MESRLALVFGNAKYQRINPLKNAVNDAVDIKAKLERLGFKVLMNTDSTWQQMHDLHKQFLSMLPDYQVGLFFFSGHGSQHNGVNFLLPVDYPSSRNRPVGEDEMRWMRRTTFSADEHLSWISRYESTKVNICILDCCRTDPLQPIPSRMMKEREKDEDELLSRDLVPFSNQPRGTIISFATGPNNTSSDGAGHNGLYTAELLKWIDKPGIRIEDMFKQVRQNVEKVSRGKQITWDHSSLINDFYMNPLPGTGIQPGTQQAVSGAADSRAISMPDGKWLLRCPFCDAEVLFEAKETTKQCSMCRRTVLNRN